MVKQSNDLANAANAGAASPPVPEFDANMPVDDHRWLGALLENLRAKWWWVAAGGAAFALLALIYLWNADYEYTASLRVSATQPASARSSGLGSLGGLAAIAGVGGLAGETATPFKLYVEGLQSRAVAKRMADNPELMHTIFAPHWDAATKRWREPASAARTAKNAVFGMLGLPVYAWEPPGAAQMQLFLAENISIDQNIKTPLVTISIQSVDPVFAVKFLTELHRVSDQLLREQSRARTESNIAYLTDKLGTVSMAEYRQVLFDSIADQEKQMMLVNNAAPFAAEPFGPATASLRPTSPRPLPTLIGSTIAGLLFGAAIAMLFGRRKRSN
ncbi:hypothetical protein EUV02_08770 [Polymorphobacter arshaanensis]|uniref:Polysaccharide chain length determinant N-terminal domain-containing protein n=1 Tax=Glacieibacterium arshaanense TaxID=2511025 RepID=A0A4Y9EMM2_9SPHN|nr:Wzz/FepE/Etk N-terminal domain-containing protein [Polymorphobacter arshaanensis]TFU03272.1 hypothetical protein EUV02_08770 [Polymorphobacter arshaanensis]